MLQGSIDAPATTRPEPIVPNAALRIEDDRRAKWACGRQEHGPVMVEDPLAAIYSECLDAINYAESLRDDPSLAGDLPLIMTLASEARRMAKVVMFIQREHPDRQWQPTELQFK